MIYTKACVNDSVFEFIRSLLTHEWVSLHVSVHSLIYSILDELQENITVTCFKFLTPEQSDEYYEKIVLVDEELQKNKEIVDNYSPIQLENSPVISIRHIKICRRKFKILKFEFAIIESDWNNLIYHLSLDDNKILGLDFTLTRVKLYFHKFLDVMRSKNLYVYFDYIILGSVKLGRRKLVKLASYFINDYCEEERDYPTSMFRYLVLWNNQIHYNIRLKHNRKRIKEISKGSQSTGNLGKVNKKANSEQPLDSIKNIGRLISLKIRSEAKSRDREFSNIQVPSQVAKLETRRNESVMHCKIRITRNLTVFDYKVLYAICKFGWLKHIDKHWLIDLKVTISETVFDPPKDFNPNGLWFSEIRSVIRAMDYYCVDNEFQRRINFRLILWATYINFFIMVIVCIIVPITSKDVCGHGLFMRAHFLMGLFLFLGFLCEFLLFFVAIPFDLLKRIIISAKGDLRDKAHDKIATFLAIVINGWFFVSGVVAKADIYTDVAFFLEALSWGYPMVFLSSVIIFMLSIAYQMFSFVKLWFKIHAKNGVFPASEQAARLCLCWEFRCLALILEKFSLTYYTKFMGKKLHTPKLLAFLKWFFEDMPQFWIQLYFILATEGTSSPLVYLSIFFSSTSLVMSFIAFLIATTSILSNRDMKELKESGVITNFEKSESPTVPDLNDEHHEKKRWFLAKSRLDDIMKMPAKTRKEKENKDKRMAEVQMEFNDVPDLTELAQLQQTQDKNQSEFDSFQQNVRISRLLKENVTIEKRDQPKRSYLDVPNTGGANTIQPHNVSLFSSQVGSQMSSSFNHNNSEKKTFWWYKPGKVEEIKYNSFNESKIVPHFSLDKSADNKSVALDDQRTIKPFSPVSEATRVFEMKELNNTDSSESRNETFDDMVKINTRLLKPDEKSKFQNGGSKINCADTNNSY